MEAEVGADVEAEPAVEVASVAMRFRAREAREARCITFSPSVKNPPPPAISSTVISSTVSSSVEAEARRLRFARGGSSLEGSRHRWKARTACCSFAPAGPNLPKNAHRIWAFLNDGENVATSLLRSSTESVFALALPVHNTNQTYQTRCGRKS